jgi:hypothetical protein
MGLMKRTCPLLKGIKVRRTLYLTLAKSQLQYEIEIWSPKDYTLNKRLKRVQRRATRWILQCKLGEIPYRERLQKLNILPLAYDREIKDLVFFYNSMYGGLQTNLKQHVSFVVMAAPDFVSSLISL